MQTQQNTLLARMDQEKNLPNTAFRINGNGAVLEGIVIELNHPQTGGQPAIYVGSHYVKRSFGNGCIYQPTSDFEGIVRRLSLQYKDNIAYAAHQDRTSTSLMLHVDPRVKLPNNVKQLEDFWFGVHTSAEVHAMSRGEMLIEFKNLFDDSTRIFYSDGSVVRVVRNGNSLTTVKMTLEEQANQRIELALWNISNTSDVLIIDRNYHQLIAIMSVAGRRNQTVNDRIFDILEVAAKKGSFAQTVLDHASKVLDKDQPLLGIRLRSVYMPRVPASFIRSAMPSITSPSQRKGPPLERVKKLAERRALDAAHAITTKGTGGGGNSNHQKGGKKK